MADKLFNGNLRIPRGVLHFFIGSLFFRCFCHFLCKQTWASTKPHFWEVTAIQSRCYYVLMLFSCLFFCLTFTEAILEQLRNGTAKFELVSSPTHSISAAAPSWKTNFFGDNSSRFFARIGSSLWVILIFVLWFLYIFRFLEDYYACIWALQLSLRSGFLFLILVSLILPLWGFLEWISFVDKMCTTNKVRCP